MTAIPGRYFNETEGVRHQGRRREGRQKGRQISSYVQRLETGATRPNFLSTKNSFRSPSFRTEGISNGGLIKGVVSRPTPHTNTYSHWVGETRGWGNYESPDPPSTPGPVPVDGNHNPHSKQKRRKTDPKEKGGLTGHPSSSLTSVTGRGVRRLQSVRSFEWSLLRPSDRPATDDHNLPIYTEDSGTCTFRHSVRGSRISASRDWSTTLGESHRKCAAT